MTKRISKKETPNEMKDMFPETVDGFHLHEHQMVNDKFFKIFGAPFKRFYESMLSVVFCRITIDLIKFDDWLHEKHGEYEGQGKSMKDIIKEKYGEDAVKFLAKLIGGE